MRLRKSSGTSLIEILVVIVVFLVGILALVQIFPPGLTTLMRTGDMALATSLAAAERDRIEAKRGELPDYIATVTHYLGPTGLMVFIDGSQPTREMMPPKDADPLPGRLDPNGIIILNNLPLAEWPLTAASNRISRVIGESHEVPAPQMVGRQLFGSFVQLNFGPIYYFLLPSGVGEPGVLQVYGNELAQREGDRKSVNPIPASFGTPRDWEFFFVDRAKTIPTGPFAGQDQVWFGSATAKDVRLALTFSYNGPLGAEQYSSIHNLVLNPAAPPAYATIVDNYWVVSLPLLVGQPDIHGRSLYSPASVTGVYRDSVNIQRLYQEISILSAFNPANPYQYKLINGNHGSVLVNPAAFDYKVRNSQGQQVPLLASADYTVLDWRIMRDEFRLPQEPGDIKLLMSGIKPLGAFGPDGRSYGGLGFIGPALTPTAQLEYRQDDFALLDLQTGGIIMGNMPDAASPQNSYSVGKTRGYLQIRDMEADVTGIQAFVAYATGTVDAPFDYFVEDISGHAVRALYQARGEWSSQVYKAASRYRVTDVVAANGLQIAECYVGASRTDLGGASIGQPTRLYFPLSDLGQRVVAGEVWYSNGGQLKFLRDQDMLISNVENLNGVDHAYAELGPQLGGGTFNFSMGYAVKRLRGASLTVRVMNNPATFVLVLDEIENYNRLENWSKNWRKHETESFILGGNN